MFGKNSATKPAHPDAPPAAGNDKPSETSALKESARAHSIIAGDAAITGDLISEGDITIEGKVDGNIKCHCLTLSGAPEINGSADAETVIVAGAFNGDIRAKKVVLAKNARMRGDIFKETLEIHPGAEFEGKAGRIEGTPVKPNGSEKESSPASGKLSTDPAPSRRTAA